MLLNDVQNSNYSGEFKIIQTTVVQDEPAAFPVFVSAALFPQPALSNRIEECEHKVVAIIDGYFKRLPLYTTVTFL